MQEAAADFAPWGSSRSLMPWDGIEGPDQRAPSFSHLFPTLLPRKESGWGDEIQITKQIFPANIAKVSHLLVIRVGN